MIRTNNKLAFVAGSMLLMGLGTGLAGCVEQEVSVSLSGSVVYEGEIVEVKAGDSIFVGGEVVEVTEDMSYLACDKASVQPGSAELYYFSGDFDLSEGQPLYFTAEITNLLEQSSQGTGSENFPGLRQDQNSITITKASIRFPAELNNFPGAANAETFLAKPELFTAVLDSGGGAALVTFPLIGSRDFPDARKFYEAAIGAAGLDPATQDAIVPLVAEIQVEGTTFSGQVVESNAFQFPISLCMDCELSTTPLCVVQE